MASLKNTKVAALLFCYSIFLVGCNSGNTTITKNSINSSSNNLKSKIILKNDEIKDGKFITLSAEKQNFVQFKINSDDGTVSIDYLSSGTRSLTCPPIEGFTPTVATLNSSGNGVLVLDERGYARNITFDVENRTCNIEVPEEGSLSINSTPVAVAAIPNNDKHYASTIVIDSEGIVYQTTDIDKNTEVILIAGGVTFSHIIYDPSKDEIRIYGTDQNGSGVIYISQDGGHTFSFSAYGGFNDGTDVISAEASFCDYVPQQQPGNTNHNSMMYFIPAESPANWKLVDAGTNQSIVDIGVVHNTFFTDDKKVLTLSENDESSSPIFLLAGSGGDITRSLNGESWNKVPNDSEESQITNIQDIAGSGGIFLINGTNYHGEPVMLTTENGDVFTNTNIPPFNNVVAGSDFACGINNESFPNSTSLYCWGSNEAGQLGYGKTFSVPLPKLVNDNLIFQSVALGGKHACALKSISDFYAHGGLLYCWGNNEYGQLGIDESETFITTPERISGNVLFNTYSLGRFHTCAISESGQVFCWGSNEHGQLGVDKISQSNIPILVSSKAHFKSVALTKNTSCAITESNSALCWGSNRYGQLGVGNVGVDYYTPTLIPNYNFYFISSGTGNHICGITPNGGAYCWGDNRYGQLGIGSSSKVPADTPQHIPTRTKLTYITAGLQHTCALDHNGYAYCWGNNQYGQLDSFESSILSPPAAPIMVDGKYPTWSSITAGDFFTCGVINKGHLLISGRTYCWGKNDKGQLGDNSRIDRNAPVWINSYTNESN